MAKHKAKRPSGDTIEDADAVAGAHPIAPVSDAEVTVVELPDGHIYADLLDDNRRLLKRVTINESDKGFRINYDGKAWDHVSDAPDGVWQFTQV